MPSANANEPKTALGSRNMGRGSYAMEGITSGATCSALSSPTHIQRCPAGAGCSSRCAKYVECVFGRLKGRFRCLKLPLQLHDGADVHNMFTTCSRRAACCTTWSSNTTSLMISGQRKRQVPELTKRGSFRARYVCGGVTVRPNVLEGKMARVAQLTLIGPDTRVTVTVTRRKRMIDVREGSDVWSIFMEADGSV